MPLDDPPEPPAWTGRIGPPPPLDPDLVDFARAFARDWPPITPAMIPLLRRPSALPLATDEQLSRDGAYSVAARPAPGPQGAPDVPLVLCLPIRAPTPTPVIYHLHGGGLFAGAARFDLPALLDLVDDLGVAVVAADYRLPPETPHPGPVEDCYAGLVWIFRHAADLGLDPTRVVLEGSSGGAGLAAAVALLARDRGGPRCRGQMLLSPMLDDRNNTPSARQLATAGLWDGVTNDTAWGALLGDARGTPGVSPYAAPARAEDLSDLPPAFVDVGAVEIFRDEAIAYASGLCLAGGCAELHVWAGGFHGFDHALPGTALSQDAIAARRGWLRRILRRPTDPPPVRQDP